MQMKATQVEVTCGSGSWSAPTSLYTLVQFKTEGGETAKGWMMVVVVVAGGRRGEEEREGRGWGGSATPILTHKRVYVLGEAVSSRVALAFA